jgi:hypothetical protein
MATLELKGLSERQRADHADKMYNILKGNVLLQWINGQTELQREFVLLLVCNVGSSKIRGFLRPPLWFNVQSSYLESQRSRIRFPTLPDFLSGSGFATRST